MEMTFYDDSQFRSGSKSLKRPATLNLDSPDTATKKQRFTAILTSPDLNMLKLATPDIERFIIANGSLLATPTPTTQHILFSKDVTEEQENYAKGFIDALDHLHRATEHHVYLTTAPGGQTSVIRSPKGGTASVLASLSNHLTPRPPSVDNSNSNSNSSSVPFSIKEEFQTVPSDFSSPPLSPIGHQPHEPIDMADQERIKLERKRYRNRIAASKCRKRKLEKISQLEEKVRDLKGENTKLETLADRLREQVYALKQTVLDHVKKGCQIMVHQTL